jgi:hypothetical protein
MLRQPAFQDRERLLQNLAHRRRTSGSRIEPDRKLDNLIYQPTRSVVYFLGPFLDPSRMIREQANRNKCLSGKSSSKGRSHRRPIAEDANVEVIPHALGLGALDNKILQQSVDGIDHPVGLLSAFLAASKWIVH